MIAGFKAANHPQQTQKRGAEDAVDDRWTPDEVFDPLHKEFAFTLDVAASASNRRCQRYFTREQNGLSLPWLGERVWCNPPYSDLPAWVAKAGYETTMGGCPLVAMLLPNNRCEQRWWQETVECVRDRGLGVSTRFLAGRRRFARPTEWATPRKGDRPPFGLVIVIFEGAS